MEKEKPPVFGVIQRGGDVRVAMLANFRQPTIEPIIKDAVAGGSLIYTDEYGIYNRLKTWRYSHKTVNHSID